MAKLHLFNPENDLALASGQANFTPPKAAVALRTAGAALPLWYADADDRVLTYGINEHWLDDVRQRFGIDADVYDHKTTDGLLPAPWGWSDAARKDFITEGWPDSKLPTLTELEIMRQLSHRRTAAVVQRMLSERIDFEIAPAAVECDSIESVTAYLEVQPDAMIKSPWSSSGRGLLDTRHVSREETLRRCKGIISRQGSVMAECAYDRIADFAMLFECSDGLCRSIGYSVFDTDKGGAYTGNILAPDSDLLDILSQKYSSERLESVREALEQTLSEYIAPHYHGPLGVDMLLARRPDGTILLDATVEINLRMTMGFVAHNLTSRYLAEGSRGHFYVESLKQTPVIDDMIVENRRMVNGRINLTPPGGLFSFVVETRPYLPEMPDAAL